MRGMWTWVRTMLRKVTGPDMTPPTVPTRVRERLEDYDRKFEDARERFDRLHDQLVLLDLLEQSDRTEPR